MQGLEGICVGERVVWRVQRVWLAWQVRSGVWNASVYHRPGLRSGGSGGGFARWAAAHGEAMGWSYPCWAVGHSSSRDTNTTLCKLHQTLCTMHTPVTPAELACWASSFHSHASSSPTAMQAPHQKDQFRFSRTIQVPRNVCCLAELTAGYRFRGV